MVLKTNVISVVTRYKSGTKSRKTQSKIKERDKNVVREAALMSPSVENNNLMAANNTREIGQYGHQLPNF